MYHRTTRQELAQQGPQRERGTDQRQSHPDPRRDVERQEADGQEGDDRPGHVVEDRRRVELGVEGDPRPRILRRIPRTHAGEDGAGPGPEAGEVVDVSDLETPIRIATRYARSARR